jgi:hypothetical protein
MANLVSTTVTGKLRVDGQMLGGTNSDQTPWYQISYTGSTTAYIHVRLPLPADTTYLGWNPSILEVYGFNGYSGDKVHDFKAVLNVNGYDNGWYGSQIPMNDGYQSSPTVYRSTNTYDGKTRVCFSVRQDQTLNQDICSFVGGIIKALGIILRGLIQLVQAPQEHFDGKFTSNHCGW